MSQSQLSPHHFSITYPHTTLAAIMYTLLGQFHLSMTTAHTPCDNTIYTHHNDKGKAHSCCNKTSETTIMNMVHFTQKGQGSFTHCYYWGSCMSGYQAMSVMYIEGKLFYKLEDTETCHSIMTLQYTYNNVYEWSIAVVGAVGKPQACWTQDAQFLVLVSHVQQFEEHRNQFFTDIYRFIMLTTCTDA